MPSLHEWQMLDEEEAARDPIVEFNNERKERFDTQIRCEAWKGIAVERERERERVWVPAAAAGLSEPG